MGRERSFPVSFRGKDAGIQINEMFPARVQGQIRRNPELSGRRGRSFRCRGFGHTHDRIAGHPQMVMSYFRRVFNLAVASALQIALAAAAIAQACADFAPDSRPQRRKWKHGA